MTIDVTATLRPWPHTVPRREGHQVGHLSGGRPRHPRRGPLARGGGALRQTTGARAGFRFRRRAQTSGPKKLPPPCTVGECSVSRTLTLGWVVPAHPFPHVRRGHHAH